MGFTEISQENIKNLYTSDITFAPTLIENYQFSKVESKGLCVKQGSMSFLHQNLVNLYILYKLDARSKDLNTNFTLGNWLLGAKKLTKNTDLDKCKYSGYGTDFFIHVYEFVIIFSNVIIFGVDNSSFVHIDNEKDIS